MIRKSWSENMVAEQLMEISKGTGFIPSNSELNELGRSDLANQITRRGGFISWAERLGLKRRGSASDTGWGGEKELAAILTQMEFEVQPTKLVKAPYDLRVNDSLRLDVKTARFAEYGVCRGWFYRIGKNPQADILALFQIDTKDCYFIPWQNCPTTNVTISRDGGKYIRYKNCYGILKNLADQRLTEQQIWNQPFF